MGRSPCSPLPTVRAQHSASDLLWDPSWSLWLGLTGVFKGYVDWQGNTKRTSKVFSIHQCFQNWKQGAYCHVTASESWTLPCKSTLYLGSCLHSSWRPRPKDAQLFSTLQCKLSHLQLRSQGRQSTLGALKVIRLLHLYCPLKWMVCRVLAGGAGEPLSGSQERLQVGGPPGRTWHVSPAPCLKNVMPLSQTAGLHQSSLVFGTHLWYSLHRFCSLFL